MGLLLNNMAFELRRFSVFSFSAWVTTQFSPATRMKCRSMWWELFRKEIALSPMPPNQSY